MRGWGWGGGKGERHKQELSTKEGKVSSDGRSKKCKGATSYFQLEGEADPRSETCYEDIEYTHE